MYCAGIEYSIVFNLVINVDFERSSYTIPEGSSLMNHVYLVKPNGQATEEDITITVTAISLTSTLGKSTPE